MRPIVGEETYVSRQVNWDRRLASVLAGLRGRFWVLWVLTAILAVFAITGTMRIRFDDELIRFFDSDIPAYADYKDLTRNFESDSDDVIMLIEAQDLADPVLVGAVSDFLLDVQFVDGVRAVISPFSLRVSGADGVEEPLFPYPPLPQAEMAARLDTAIAQDDLLGRMMAADRTAMVIILPITDEDGPESIKRRTQIDALAELGQRLEDVSGARARLAGYPVLREEVADALLRDVMMLVMVGVVMAFGIAVITFRSVRLALLILPGPISAVAITTGLHGYLDVSINTMTITLPVLVLVLATSDAIHIGFERARQGGRDTIHATVRAVRRVAIACIFAAVTTAIAFGALGFSRSEIVAEMGRMGVLVTLASVVTVLLIQTVVFSYVGRFAWFAPLIGRLHDHPPHGFGLGRLPNLAFASPRRVAWIGMAALVVSTGIYSQAAPVYSLMDSLHGDAPIRQVFDAMEERVAPVSQLQVPVNSTDPAVLQHVQDVLEDVTGSPHVQSVAGAEGGSDQVVNDLPQVWAHRMVSYDGSKTLVSVPFRYTNGGDTLALANEIDTRIAAEPELDEGIVGNVTGLPVMSSRVADVVLDEINRSLILALVGVVVLIAIWLRNIRISLISLIPNMLPITILGTWMMYSRGGVEFSTAMALTVAFGIAVDDTLHVLNRLHLSGGVDRIELRRLRAVFVEVSPALITTSVLLVLGMSGTLFAENKGVADFGEVAIAVYALALIADLVVLPAALIAFDGRGKHRMRTSK